PGPATLAASFVEGTAVSLSAAASTGSTFAGWDGACSGSGACSVVLNSDASVTARFSATAPPQQTFVLTVKMNGSGSVDSSPAGIACGQACTATFAAGTQVQLVAHAAAGSLFARWDAECLPLPVPAGRRVAQLSKDQTASAPVEAQP